MPEKKGLQVIDERPRLIMHEDITHVIIEQKSIYNRESNFLITEKDRVAVFKYEKETPDTLILDRITNGKNEFRMSDWDKDRLRERINEELFNQSIK